MLAKSWALLKVNSANAQLVLMLGSEGFVTAGSTRAGPGLMRKVRVLSTENQIRPPAIWGIVTFTVFPGPPRGMAQSVLSWAPGSGGEVGKYGVWPSAWRRKRPLFESMA